MDCTGCGNEIQRGETYTSILRQTERAGRFGAISVTGTESEAYYHQACAPAQR
jgi:hypothetical protein